MILDSRGRELRRAFGFLGGLTPSVGERKPLADAVASASIEVEEDGEDEQKTYRQPLSPPELGWPPLM